MVQRPTAAVLHKDNSKAPHGLRRTSLEAMKQQDLRRNLSCAESLSFFSLESPTGAAAFLWCAYRHERNTDTDENDPKWSCRADQESTLRPSWKRRDSASTIHSVPTIVRWVWQLINFCGPTPAGFRPEEDSRSRGSPELCRRGLARSAGQQNAAGSVVVDSNERAFAKCKVQSLTPLAVPPSALNPMRRLGGGSGGGFSSGRSFS
jgi:hypothetical protein